MYCDACGGNDVLFRLGKQAKRQFSGIQTLLADSWLPEAENATLQ